MQLKRFCKAFRVKYRNSSRHKAYFYSLLQRHCCVTFSLTTSRNVENMHAYFNVQATDCVSRHINWSKVLGNETQLSVFCYITRTPRQEKKCIIWGNIICLLTTDFVPLQLCGFQWIWWDRIWLVVGVTEKPTLMYSFGDFSLTYAYRNPFLSFPCFPPLPVKLATSLMKTCKLGSSLLQNRTIWHI